jgi:hypothetical protein
VPPHPEAGTRRGPHHHPGQTPHPKKIPAIHLSYTSPALTLLPWNPNNDPSPSPAHDDLVQSTTDPARATLAAGDPDDT